MRSALLVVLLLVGSAQAGELWPEWFYRTVPTSKGLETVRCPNGRRAHVKVLPVPCRLELARPTPCLRFAAGAGAALVPRACKLMLAADWQRLLKTLGAEIRTLRRLVGWSQQDLADRAVTSQGTVSRLEAGNTDALEFRSVVITIQTLCQAAADLELPLSPMTQGLAAFTRELINGQTKLVLGPHPEVLFIVRSMQAMPAPQRALFVSLMHAVATILDHQLGPEPDGIACVD